MFFLKNRKKKDIETIASLQKEVKRQSERIAHLEKRVSEAESLINQVDIKYNTAHRYSSDKISNYVEITSSQIDTITKKQRVIYTWIFLLCAVSMFSTAAYMKFF
jgi:cell division protein FtsL